MKKTEKLFRFYTRLILSKLTGNKASTIIQFLKYIREASDACIYYHTHRFLQIHQHLCPEPPNDFAYWVGNIFKEEELAEKLASIDTIQFTTIKSLRDKIVSIIEECLKRNPKLRFKFVEIGQEFHFIEAMSFIMPTKHTARNLKEFVDSLKKVTINSVYYHMFEARIRLEKGSNDFSSWFDAVLNDKELADKVAKMDPYSFTMEGLRCRIISLIEAKLLKND